MTDVILINALIRTLDARQPESEAMAISGRRVAALGTSAEIRRLAGPETRMLDGGGRLVLPGFNDAHVHFLSGGFGLSGLSLRDTTTPKEFAERIADWAGTVRPGDWITGGGWDHERWPGAPLPTKDLIDPATPEIPVFVSRLDGHMALANSRALELAGLTRDTADPKGGLILRDRKTGTPTGLLKDAAMNLVSRVVPTPTFEQKLVAARAATQHAASLGVTSVQDMSAGADVGVYQTLLQSGELKTRIYAAWPLPKWPQLAALGVRAGFGNEWLRIGALKGFCDGSLGAGTALFFEPYTDTPHTRGLPADEMFPEGAMLERVLGADRAGLQVIIHAIGDQANDQILSLFEHVARQSGKRDRRWRVEHAQHLRPPDFPRFARAGVIASMQPSHAADDGRWAERRIGPERAKTTYPFRSLLDAGATLAFGSDWAVAPLDPLQGIASAVTRHTLDGKNPEGWVPDQKITVEEAVRAYTLGSAGAEFQDQVKGTLYPGSLADLVMLSQDIFKIPATDIDKTCVMMTMVDGRVAYEAR